MIERPLDLAITIEEIEEPEGGVILGCLRTSTREIVLNERHMDLFERVPGLMRYTLGHETGHSMRLLRPSAPAGRSSTPRRGAISGIAARSLHCRRW